MQPPRPPCGAQRFLALACSHSNSGITARVKKHIDRSRNGPASSGAGTQPIRNKATAKSIACGRVRNTTGRSSVSPGPAQVRWRGLKAATRRVRGGRPVHRAHGTCSSSAARRFVFSRGDCIGLWSQRWRAPRVSGRSPHRPRHPACCLRTSGGANPIRCHGHRKADAVEIKRLIEGYQGAHHRVG